MNRTITKTFSAVVCTVMAGTALAAPASRDGLWKFELTPYIWAAGIKADVEVADREAELDASFSDIADNLDMAAAFLATAQYRSLVTWLQVDYLDLSTDLENARGSVESKMTLTTFGLGYQFQGFADNQTIDALLGVRNLNLDKELKLDSGGNFSSDRDITDPVIIVRPSFQLSERWRFNPTLSYGTGGDSESTYELQPQFQYQLLRNGAIRFGYRRLGYDIENDNGSSFDGVFEGPFFGIGFTFR